jgi:ABC-type antimicrobial peptide transport system permease subunit
MLLGLGFGAVALFLSALGIYGVLAYQVAQRTREIGIRMALGSSTREILGLVLREGALMLAFGLAIGLGGALALGRAMQTLLFDVAPTDPIVLTSGAATLALVALIGSALPARRAARINPATALGE